MADESEKSTDRLGTLESSSLQVISNGENAQIVDGDANQSPPSEKAETTGLEPTVLPLTTNFPEGGSKAWAAVVGSFCFQICGFGYTTSFGVYQDYYTRTYITSESPSTISWIGSVNAFIVISGGLVAGRLYDKGYFYYMMFGGTALIVVSLFTLSLSHPDHIYQNFLAQALGHGVGAGLMYVPSLAVLSHYFHRKRSLVMAVVASGSSLGAVVHPIMLNNLFKTLGFKRAVQASAGMVTGLLLISCLLMHPRLPPPARSSDLWQSLRKFSRDGPYVFATLGLLLSPISVYFPLFFTQLDAAEHGLSQKFSFYSLVILNVGSIIGRVTVGILTRYIKVIDLTVLSTVLCAVMIFSLIGVTTVAGFVVFGILYGISAGASIAIMPPLLAVLSEDINEMGLRMGIAFAFCGLGALIGPPANGALLTKNFVWWKPAVFSGVFGLIATAMFIVTRYLLRRRQKKKAQASRA